MPHLFIMSLWEPHVANYSRKFWILFKMITNVVNEADLYLFFDSSHSRVT